MVKQIFACCYMKIKEAFLKISFGLLSYCCYFLVCLPAVAWFGFAKNIPGTHPYVTYLFSWFILSISSDPDKTLLALASQILST